MISSRTDQAVPKNLPADGSFKIPRAFLLSPWKKKKQQRRSIVWNEEELLNGMPLAARTMIAV